MQNIFNTHLPIAMGSDHAGFELKEAARQWLEREGVALTDKGTYSKDSVDYPDFAHAVAAAVEDGTAACGLLFCGSANGVAITANKHAGVRAAIAWQDEIAALARQHNNANVLCLPARYIGQEEGLQMIRTFLATQFEGGRHAGRVAKISC